ncbi:type I methionyl aminopeptidase [Desulfurivibrio sp. C05AmB]|uniref:type I methionyl aminopeptidase n=1 Tax=Desulfurivibrio sp. C05AmB TaxID=3374371 RepID=UPI00376EA5A0
MTNAVVLKSAAEIEIMRGANRIVAGALAMLGERIKPGVTTTQLDAWAEEYARDRGGIPAFKGYRGFPGSLCVSLNEQVVHGIPSNKVVIRSGDIVSIDFGVKWRGYYGDAAITVPVGEVGAQVRELLRVTRESLNRAIAQVQVGNRINDISRAVQEYVEKHGFSVVRQFVGHGIGSQLHEPPEIPNYVRSNGSPRLMAGMVLAIEPMVNIGTAEVKILADGWTVVTRDKKYSAHFEHSVAVTENGPLVLSAWELR